MSGIIFYQPKVKTDIFNKEPYVHIFKGLNNYHSIIKKVKIDYGCSCTGLTMPEQIEPNQEFEVIFKVNKVGSKGLYSTYAKITWDNGQESFLQLNGKIIDE